MTTTPSHGEVLSSQRIGAGREKEKSTPGAASYHLSSSTVLSLGILGMAHSRDALNGLAKRLKISQRKSSAGAMSAATSQLFHSNHNLRHGE